MDFIVSKVAMSVCALLLMGAVLGAFHGNDFLKPTGELREIAGSFCTIAEGMLRGRVEGEILWKVPFLASGDPVTVSLGGVSVMVSGSGGVALERTSVVVHTWRWDGTAINSSQVRGSDLSALRLRASSGSHIELSSARVAVDDELQYLLFAGLSAPENRWEINA